MSEVDNFFVLCKVVLYFASV